MLQKGSPHKKKEWLIKAEREEKFEGSQITDLLDQKVKIHLKTTPFRLDFWNPGRRKVRSAIQKIVPSTGKEDPICGWGALSGFYFLRNAR